MKEDVGTDTCPKCSKNAIQSIVDPQISRYWQGASHPDIANRPRSPSGFKGKSYAMPDKTFKGN